MKTKIIFTFAVLVLALFTSKVQSQLTSDYPFKTFLDSENNLFVTGFDYNSNTNSNNISVLKYTFELGYLNSYIYNNFSGNDRGMDIIVDHHGYSYVSGYIYNQQSHSNDIIVLKLDPQLNLMWHRVFINPGDDKAYAIDILKDDFGDINEIYTTGYYNNSNNQKEIYVSRLDEYGGLSWQTDTSFSGKWDVATDIFADYNNVYVSGYSFQGHQNGDDAIYVTLDKASGSIGAGDVIIHNIPGSNEKPTALTVVNRSDSYLSKSRSVVTSISDNFGLNNNNNKPNVFRTTFYNLDSNNKVRIKWSKEFRNKGVGGTNIATSIAKDDFENIFVTGYSTSNISENELDFVTIKYKFEDGSYGWPSRGAEFYNFRNDSIPSSSYNDRASTIKVSGDTIVYVAGMSDASPSGFSIIQYKNDNSGNLPTKRWAKVYNPIFETPYTTAESSAQRWATIEVDSEGQPILIAMEWNGDYADWKAIKYDVDGNVIATTSNEDNSDQIVKENSGSNLKRSGDEITKTQLLQNKPNPFNPSTEIFYSVSQNGFVNIKVYNLLGQEVAALVNEMKQPGNYQIRFDGSGLSSGMYFYKMFVNENLIDGKRMLLLK
ncbi:MAG: T9SS type A sorting domain-containing protein [Ignavibacteria bacterium]